MSEEPRPYLVNQQAASDAVRQVEHLSDQQLEQIVLNMLADMGCPGLPPGTDTSRQGLLDFIAGIAAIAFSTPASVEEE